MPTTYNGVGTDYFGKGEVVKRPAICQFCKRSTNLESYNTTLYFVVLFLPLFPLGRKRIIDKCPACTRHQVAPLEQYQKARAADIDEAVKAFCSDPTGETAARALDTTIHYRAVDAFRGAATLAEESLPEFSEIQYRIGTGHVFFGHYPEAEQSFQRSLSLAFSTECAEEYARLLLKLKRPADAHVQLQHLLDHPAIEKQPLVNYLADTYQVVGQHRKALETLQSWEQHLPAASQNKMFKRLLARALKYQNSTQPIKPLGAETSPHLVWVLVGLVVALIVVIFLSTRRHN